LTDIDYKAASCVLGRVLIFRKYRGNGCGKAMVQAAVKFAFENLFLAEVTLGVFDFNTPAINTYKSIGFSETQFNKGARQFQDESWNVIKMKLCKKKLVTSKNCEPALSAERKKTRPLKFLRTKSIKRIWGPAAKLYLRKQFFMDSGLKLNTQPVFIANSVPSR
jgi:hypothetical protein